MSEAEKKATSKFIKAGNAKGIVDGLMFMVGAVAFSEFYEDQNKQIEILEDLSEFVKSENCKGNQELLDYLDETYVSKMPDQEIEMPENNEH